MNRPKRHLFRQVHAPKNRSWSGLESFLDIISCTCKYFWNTVQVWRGRMQMLGHVTLFPARWNLAPSPTLSVFFLNAGRASLDTTALGRVEWPCHCSTSFARCRGQHRLSARGQGALMRWRVGFDGVEDVPALEQWQVKGLISLEATSNRLNLKWQMYTPALNW